MNDYFEYNFHVEFEENKETISCKKPKRNAPVKKERKQFIDLSLAENIQYNAALDKENVEVGKSGAIIISDSGITLRDNDTGEEFPINLPLITSYERKSGKAKILNYYPSGKLTDSNKILLEYDCILAIDTNTRGSTSVTAIARCYPNPTSSGFEGIISIKCKQWDSSQSSKPEIQAWATVIAKMLQNEPETALHKNIAIVVDSELGLLSEYNTRQKPLIANFYLPPNFSLIYGSADSGGEFIPNKLIQLCDKHAAQFFNS